MSLFKLIQAETYCDKSQIFKQLNVQLFDDGLYRVVTKLLRRRDKKNFRLPVLLPGDHPAVVLLIKKVHEELSHAGVQMVISNLRERFWIPQARRTIRKVVVNCTKCRRFDCTKIKTAPAPLPVERIRSAAAFEVTGIDMAGPLYLRKGEKSWIVVFTCDVYRALHLELVQSLSTESFLQSLRRFVARRGRPKIIYTDNGLGFQGSKNLFKTVDWEKVCESSLGKSHSIHLIDWRFNPPSAPWWGGWWERLIGLIKNILKRVLGRACLNYEELLTVLC
ncbi:unnamed protein product, partial [Allacma fusca]